MQTKAADDRFQQTELVALKDELAQVEQFSKVKDERIASLAASLGSMNEKIARLAKVLAMNPSATETRHAMRQKQHSSEQ